MNKQSLNKIWIYWGIAFIEAFLVLINLLLTHSMERNTILWGYSFPRLILIMIFTFILVILLIFIPNQQNRIFKVSVGWLNNQFKNLNNLKITRDLLLFFMFVNIGLVGMNIYSPKFLGFLWSPLPIIVERIMPVLIFGALVSFQTLIILYYYFRHSLITFNKTELRERLTTISFAILIFFMALMIYKFSADLVGFRRTPAIAYFPDLAKAFLDGKLYLEEPSRTTDLTLFNGKYYVSFPPLATLLMLPKVARYTKWSINTIEFSRFFSALAISFTFLSLNTLSKRKWIKLKLPDNIWLAISLGFGTALWYISTTGRVWHISQILTATFTSLAILITLLNRSKLAWDNNRTALLAGLALGVAMLARPNIGIVWIFLLGITFQHFKENKIISLERLARWSLYSILPITCIIFGLFWYNYIRFGSPFDFGYKYMLVGPHLIDDLRTYGQLHYHYLITNIKAQWFGLPYWHAECKRFVLNPNAISFLVMSPFLVYLYRSFSRKPWIISAWISIILIIAIHLLYFNTGGYRFSLDFMVVVVCLLGFAMRDRISFLAKVLILFSIAVNFISVLFYAKLWCVTW